MSTTKRTLDLIKKLEAENKQLREALGVIDRFCTDKIRALFGRHHSKTEEEMAGKSAVYSLLVIPRNIARNALSDGE